MSTAALNLPYTPQLDSGAIRSFVFAVMVHGALFGFLYFGVRWQSETPLPIEAELWTAVPSAPAPVPRAEAPRAEVKPEPKPEVKEVPVVKPDIAVKDEKKEESQTVSSYLLQMSNLRIDSVCTVRKQRPFASKPAL